MARLLSAFSIEVDFLEEEKREGETGERALLPQRRKEINLLEGGVFHGKRCCIGSAPELQGSDF